MIDVTPIPGARNEQPSRRPRAAAMHPRCGSDAPMNVAEIVTVCMGDLLHELREFLPAARVAFPGKRIHIYTDRGDESFAIAKEVMVENVEAHFTPDASKQISIEKVAKHSDYWKPWPIWWKLRALQERVAYIDPASRDGVLLVDCDVTFREGFERPFRGDVALSPFYWGRRDIDIPAAKGGGLLQHRDGEFNAGMLVTRSRDFCDWWMRAYLDGLGGFYEQGCLDLVPGLFTTDYTSPLHNWGKWRFAAPHGAVRSFHQHLSEPSRRMDVGALKMAAQRAAGEARETLQSFPSRRA